MGRLDPVNSNVRVGETVVEVRGKLVIGRPKFKAGMRTVPTPPAVSEVLAEHVGDHPADGWGVLAGDQVVHRQSSAKSGPGQFFVILGQTGFFDEFAVTMSRPR